MSCAVIGAQAPTAAWFAISAAVRPPITAAVAVGDCVRRALIAHSDGHPTFIGRADDGAPRATHRHAFFLPSDDDGDGRLDRILICARDTFDDRALQALALLQQAPIWGYGGPDLRLTTIATCRTADIGGVASEAMRGRAAQVGPARTWESHTPFVLPRFPRTRGGCAVDTVEAQARQMLASLGLPDPVVIEALSGGATPAGVTWQRFLLQRRWGGGARGPGRGHGLRLVFAIPVSGPIALGYGAHQGLGQFVAIAR